MLKTRTKTGNKNGSKWIRPVKRLAIYLRDGFRCVYCSVNLAGAEAAEYGLDHVVARSKRVCNGEGNLVTACRSCNSSRQDRTVAEWKPEAVAAVRRHTRRKLAPYLEQAKTLRANASNGTSNS